MRCKPCFYITGSIVAATIIFAIVNRRKKKKEVIALELLLDPTTGAKALGNAFSPSYWRDLNLAGTIKKGKTDAERAQGNAKIIYDSLGYLQSDNDQRVIEVFGSMASKADVSMTADAFLTNYKKDMKEHLSHLSEQSYLQVIKIVNKLKDY
jgi:hypothetical protein